MQSPARAGDCIHRGDRWAFLFADIESSLPIGHRTGGAQPVSRGRAGGRGAGNGDDVDRRDTRPPAGGDDGAVLLVFAVGRSFARLPAWRDNRAELLALLTDHPESYRGHGSAAAVLAGTGETAGARREYAIADSLFPEDPFLIASRAIFLLSIGDTVDAAPLVTRAQETAGHGVGDRPALRARFVLELARGHRRLAVQLADSASRRFTGEARWYRLYFQ